MVLCAHSPFTKWALQILSCSLGSCRPS